MPYQNPERKRQWERERREKRNAMRRMNRLNARSGYTSIPNPAPDPVSDQKSQVHMEDNSWLGNRHRSRSACGNRRGQPARIVTGAALFLTEGEQTAQTCANA